MKKCNKKEKNLFSGGSVLILDKTLNPNKDGPAFLCQQDLLMLAVCNGKERTEEEFKSLLVGQGFKNFTVKKDANSPYYDAIMADKP